MGQLLKQQQVKVWDIFAHVSGPLEGKLEDWPAQIQDTIYKMLEAKAHELELPLAIVDSACIIDYGDDETADKWMIQVVVSEVVAKDVGYEKRLIDSTIRMMKETKH
jgi:hypothetical protein